MSQKKKTEEAATEVQVAAQSTEDRIAALEKERDKLTQALAREIVKNERVEPVKVEKPAEPQIKMYVPIAINNNGHARKGHVTVGLAEARCLQATLGARRERLLREQIGDPRTLREILQADSAPHVVKQTG